MNFMFDIFPVIFGIMFCLVLGVFIVTLVRGIAEWGKNNASPRLSVPATVCTKRTHHSHHHTGNGTHRSTHYYVTFQFESGDRVEFSVSGSVYGVTAEGDRGTLTFQGTRFLEFTRE